MNTLRVFKAIGPVDFKNMRRDALLVWLPVLPILLALLLRFGMPPLAAWLDRQYAFDLVPYYPLAMSLFLLITPMLAGMVIGFLLLDERDDRMMTALLVTPMPLQSYLAYRISVPVLLGLVMTLIGYPIAGLAPVSFPDLLAAALLASISAPLVMLFLASFAENKVAGFALVKLLNGLQLIPLAAYFIVSEWQLLAGVVPVYWPLKVFWLAAEGEAYGLYFIAGLAVNLAVLAALLRRFHAAVHR